MDLWMCASMDPGRDYKVDQWIQVRITTGMNL